MLALEMRFACRAVGSLLLATCLPLAAQQDAELGELGELEELMVTVQRLPENVQAVPISVSVAQGDWIAEIGSKTPTDLIPYIPGFTGDTVGAGTPIWAIRGVSTTAYDVGSESSIGVFIDDAYVGRNMIANMAFFDLQRVEVLKGPQGTLFGRNTIAGAVNIVPNKPQFGASTLSVLAGVGNLNQREAELIANFGESKGIAWRFAAMSYEFDGYQTNLFDNTRVNGSDEWAVRASALARVSEATDITVTLQHNEFDALTTRAPNVLSTADRFPDAFFNNAPADPHETNDADGINVRIGMQLPGSVELTSISDYRTADYTFGQSLDGTPELMINFFQTDVGLRSVSQELRLRGAAKSLKWFAGASYWREHAFARNSSVVMNAFTAGQLGLIAPGSSPDDTLLSDTFGGDGVNRSYAAYADAVWSPAQRWNLRFGMRFTRDDKDWISLTRQMDLEILSPAIPGGQLASSDSWTDFSPRVVADYLLPGDHLLYASMTRGYKGGGFNTLTNGVTVASFDPEGVTAYEAGLKAAFAGGRLRINGAVYLNDYRDLQVLVIADSTNRVNNAATARILGVELESAWTTPLRGLDLIGHFTHQDAQFERGVLANIGDVEGHRLPATPENTFSFTGRYSRPLLQGGLELSTSFNWRDLAYFDASNRTELAQPSYGLLSARLRYNSPGERWGIALIGDNLLDKEYALFAQDPFGLGATYVKGRPRMYRAQVTARF